MLALVTCHIFPPSIWYGKKNEFLAPDFPADSSQFFRVHGFTSAVRQMPTAMHNPFAWTNVSSGKNACFAIWPHVGTKFFNSSHHFLSLDGWPGDTIFFLWGQPLKIIHKNSAKKRSSPLDFIFDTCASASSSHLFLVGEAEDMWLYPFARTNAFSAKNICFVIWARVDTKFLNSSHHVLSVDDWPGDATFFLWGQPLKIIRKYSVKKGPAPWILFLTRAPRPLEVTFFGWWSWTYVVVPLLPGQMYFQRKNMCFAIWARVDTKFLNSSHHVLSVDDWPGNTFFFPVGPTFEDYPASIQSKKGPAPWILFLTPAPRPLQVTFSVG